MSSPVSSALLSSALAPPPGPGPHGLGAPGPLTVPEGGLDAAPSISEPGGLQGSGAAHPAALEQQGGSTGALGKAGAGAAGAECVPASSPHAPPPSFFEASWGSEQGGQGGL